MKKGESKTDACLEKERGIWIIRTEKKLPASIVTRVISQVREERYRLSIGQEHNKTR